MTTLSEGVGADPASVFERGFERAGCRVAMHAVQLSTGESWGIHDDRSVVMASVMKVLVALEFFDQVARGICDPARVIALSPDSVTPGPTGLSNISDVARLSLRDLAGFMMTLSDNAATDVLLSAVGLESVNARAIAAGCSGTKLVGDLRFVLDGVGRDLGFLDYRDLLAAQAGEPGSSAYDRSHDQTRISRVAALDTARTSRTTPIDMTRLLIGIWQGCAAHPDACRNVRDLMARQVTRRLEGAVADGARLYAKSGGLFGRVRNEVATIEEPDGEAYAVAIFTHADRAFAGTAHINAMMSDAAAMAMAKLRSGA